jgi:protein-tyrosine phosphatase
MSQGQTGDDPTSKWAQETTRAIKARNRYDDIKPWASSRIHLKVPEGDLDYINASPILLKCSKTGNERKYIATQVCFHTVLGC